MHLLERTQTIDASISDVFAFFSRPENLARITPPGLALRVAGIPADPLTEGSRIAYRIRWLFLPLRWVTRIARFDPPRAFEDRQEYGPYRFWLHTHWFDATPDGRTVMTDRVEYALPLGVLGAAAHRLLVRRQIESIFDHRREAIARIFAPSPGRSEGPGA